MNLLHVDSSITGDKSVSRKISAAIVARLQSTTPGLQVVRRDLIAGPLPYFDAATLAGINVQQEPQPADKQAEERIGERLLGEFMAADVVVVGAPMYNFSIPAQLKTWADYLFRAGTTFRYTPEGPIGLAGGKRIYIASSRGGLYTPGHPAAAVEHQESYLQAMFRFFGITDVTVIRAEGLATGPDKAGPAVAQALSEAGGLGALTAAA